LERELLPESFVKPEMEFWHVPGLAISVRKEGKTVLSRGYGFSDVEAGTPVTPETQFGIASCSKSFTSAIIAMLVDEGLVGYDTPVVDYLPDFRLYDPVATAQVTLRDMLCHRTGLGGHDSMWPDTISRAEFMRRLRYLKPSAPFRSKPQYSNVMYTVIGHIAERLTGKSWEELVRERILEPLAMGRTNCSLEEMKHTPNHAEPYLYRNGKLERLAMWNVDLAGPAASVNSTVEDLSKWLEFHLRGGVTPDGKRLISEANMREMHTAQVAYDTVPWEFPEVSSHGGYGMAWVVEQYRGLPLQSHLGEIEGYCALEAFLPQQKISIAMLMNRHKPCVPIIYTLLYTLIDRMLGFPEVDWTARIHPEKDHYTNFYYDWDLNLMPEPPVPGTCPSHPMEAYAGVYHSDGYGNVRVLNRGGTLFLQYKDRTLPLEHFHYDIFRVREMKEDTLIITMPLAFQTGILSGSIDSLLLRLEPMVDDIVFRRAAE
jgi:CubicO group peptidase (beta-lactamase class C family)